jgi:methyl-accepting chemotaxis protein
VIVTKEVSAMPARILIRMTAPLLLTLAHVVAQFMNWPMAINLALLSTTVLAWAAFAWWFARDGFQLTPDEMRIVREQEQLLGELREFVTREVSGSQQEI